VEFGVSSLRQVSVMARRGVQGVIVGSAMARIAEESL